MSHPSWVCGLKQGLEYDNQAKKMVTPFVGVWIETFSSTLKEPKAGRHTLRGCVD